MWAIHESAICIGVNMLKIILGLFLLFTLCFVKTKKRIEQGSKPPLPFPLNWKGYIVIFLKGYLLILVATFAVSILRKEPTLAYLSPDQLGYMGIFIESFFMSLLVSSFFLISYFLLKAR